MWLKFKPSIKEYLYKTKSGKQYEILNLMLHIVGQIW